jgi:PTS system nitrogen regulatory IIA component
MNKRITLEPHCVLLDISCEDKFSLIRCMVRAVGKDPSILDLPRQVQHQLEAAVLERENEHATNVGEGVAMPHARVAGLEGAVFCLARLAEPIPFGSTEPEPVDLVMLFVVSEEEPQLALQVMSRFARLSREPEARERLMREKDPVKLAGFFTKRILRVEEQVLAADIMRKPEVDVYPDTPLHTVTRLMSDHTLNAVSVIEPDGTIVGIITCDALFQVGMPPFFRQLKTIAFISNYDPFREYFRFERDAVARDVMTSEFATLPEEATILEVIFALAVEKHPKVYIARDGKRIGVIDPAVVLEKVINI